LLRDHHALGRLDMAEFDDRLAKALEARTSDDLAALFADLPGRRPGEVAHSQQEVAVVQPAPLPPAPAQDVATPWWAQWWLMFVAVGAAGATNGRLGFLVPAVLVWVFFIYPSLAKHRRPAHPVRPLTAPESAEVRRLLGAGQHIQAIKRYREITGADLGTAKRDVEQMQQLGY